MKKIYIPIILLLSAFGAASAQVSANSSGGVATGTNGTVSYSVGQVVSTAHAGSSGSVNQGVQQPYEFFVTGIDDFPGIQLEMTAYPNPTRATLNLKVEGIQQSGLNYELYTSAGQLVTGARLENTITEIPMHGLAVGNYMLRVLNTETNIKNFTIIKID